MKSSNLLIYLSGLFLLIGCSSDQTRLIDYDITSQDEIFFDEIDSIANDNLYKSSSREFASLEEFVGRGSTWKLWNKVHKECMKAKWYKNPFYFGPTNTVDLGAIVNSKNELQRMIDSKTFSEDEMDTFFNEGSYASCEYSQELTINLETFIQSDFRFGSQDDVTAELSFAIKKSKNVKVKIDSWRINNLKHQDLLDVLNDAEENDIKYKQKIRFYETLKSRGNKILSKVTEIKGFTSSITLETDMSSELESKLKEGLIANVGNLGLKATFKYKNKRTIEVVSDGNFYVFGIFAKAN